MLDAERVEGTSQRTVEHNMYSASELSSLTASIIIIFNLSYILLYIYPNKNKIKGEDMLATTTDHWC